MDSVIYPDQTIYIGGSRISSNASQRGGLYGSSVAMLQQRINDVLGDFGYEYVYQDGIFGPQTAQGLCALRLVTGQVQSRNKASPGSEEERLLMSEEVELPGEVRGLADSWMFVSRVCQVMLVGSGNDLTYVFRTSTGSEGNGTRPGSHRTFLFRNPTGNDGWHNSSDFPASADNPLNGNMYLPLYFSNGQAIHGSTSVPRQPASKGCVRLTPANQDRLVGFLNLDGVSGEVWNPVSATVFVS